MCSHKNTAQPAKRGIFMKNGNGICDVLGLWAEIGKY